MTRIKLYYSSKCPLTCFLPWRSVCKWYRVYLHAQFYINTYYITLN